MLTVCSLYFTLSVSTFRVHLYWSESESKSDDAWNALHLYCAVYLHWSESNCTWKLGCNPFWSDVASNVSLSLSLQYKCSITMSLYCIRDTPRSHNCFYCHNWSKSHTVQSSFLQSRNPNSDICIHNITNIYLVSFCRTWVYWKCEFIILVCFFSSFESFNGMVWSKILIENPNLSGNTHELFSI